MEDQSQNNVGRPTVVTDAVVSKLVSAFHRGLSVSTACQYAKIGRKAFYERYNKDTEFRNRIDDAKDFGKFLAGEQIHDVLLDVTRGKPMRDEEGNVVTDTSGKPVVESPKYSEIARINVSKWYLERKESEEFGAKNSFSGNVNNNNQNNYFFVADEQFKSIRDKSGISSIPQAELIEVVKTSNMGRDNSEGTPVDVHQD